MTDPRSRHDDSDPAPKERAGGIEGVDDAALGVSAPPASAPPGAEVDPTVRRVPGPAFGAGPGQESKPWSTSLAAESDQAGVANDPPDAQEPDYPTREEHTE